MKLGRMLKLTKHNYWLPALLLSVLLTGCATAPKAPADWSAWQARRTESIGGTNGWTTLIGLAWLHEGDNSAGSAPTNQAVIRSPTVPATIGVFTRQGATVSFTPAPGADVRVNNELIGKLTLRSDAEENPTKLQLGPVSVGLIQRGDRLGLRIRDPNAPTRREFKGLHWFPYDPAWQLSGHFVPFAERRQLRVPDVTGATQTFDSPGAIVFTVHGAEYRLDVAEEAGEAEFFMLFRDQTTGDSTYAAGRFLYVNKPDASGQLIIDFNRAFTPPCGFTHFATCPLPPRQNTLPLAVTAGELKPLAAGH